MKQPEPLYVTDAEAAALVGMSLREWVATATVLERQGLPRKDPVFNDRRYWPAVRRFLDRRAGVGQDTGVPTTRRWEEHWNEPKTTVRPRPAKAGAQ